MLHASLWHDGQTPVSEFVAGSLQGVTTDGSNLFAFVGSSPYNATDPSGLFGFVSGLMTGLNIFDTMTDALDQVKMGIETGATYISQSNEYQEYLLDFIDWAMDPNAAWDAFTYTGEPLASDTGGQSDSHVLMAGLLSKGNRPIADKGLKGRKIHGNKHRHHNPAMTQARRWSRAGDMSNVRFSQTWVNPRNNRPL